VRVSRQHPPHLMADDEEEGISKQQQSTRWTLYAGALATKVDMYQCVRGGRRARLREHGPIQTSLALPMQKRTNIVSKETYLCRTRRFLCPELGRFACSTFSMNYNLSNGQQSDPESRLSKGHRQHFLVTAAVQCPSNHQPAARAEPSPSHRALASLFY